MATTEKNVAQAEVETIELSPLSIHCLRTPLSSEVAIHPALAPIIRNTSQYHGALLQGRADSRVLSTPIHQHYILTLHVLPGAGIGTRTRISGDVRLAGL